MMSRRPRRERTSLLFAVTVCFCAIQVCHPVSVIGQREDRAVYRGPESRKDGIKRNNDLKEPPTEPAAAPAEPPPHVSQEKFDETYSALNSLPWTLGDVSRQPRSIASEYQDGYQADFTVFAGVLGKVLAPSLHSSPHFSAWQAMRPLVLCDDDAMTFTASGEGFTHLLVDREGASPISLFQVPSYCGYSVWMSWSSLKMMVPYDACYITQENGSYVLPMFWLGSPLKLSCPMQMATPASSVLPVVFCSPYSMAVVIGYQEQDIQLLGVMVNGGWGPFVSEDCADQLYSNPGELSFLISYGAPCITSQDGYHLRLVIDDQEYILSCPVKPHRPYVLPSPSPPPPSPSYPHFPYIPDPVNAVPTTPPPPTAQPPTTEQIAPLSEHPRYRYPAYRLPQVYPLGPQPARPPQPTPGSPPMPQQPQPLYPLGPGKLPYTPGDELKYPPPPSQPPVEASSLPKPSPVPDRSPHQGSKLLVGPSQYSSGVYYPYMFYYPTLMPDLTSEAAPPPTQLARPPSPPPSQPKQPPAPHLSLNPFYLPALYNPYYHYGQFPHPNPGLQVQPASPSHATPAPSPPTATTIVRTMVPKQHDDPSYQFGHFYPQRPISLYPPTPSPPPTENPQAAPLDPLKPATQPTTCPLYAHNIGGYYPYPYYAYFHPLYPPHYYPPFQPVPQYPQSQASVTTKKPQTTTTATSSTTTTPTPTTTGSTASTSPEPTPHIPHLQCLMSRVIAFLPFAHPDTIQVRDQMKTWLPLSSVSPLCGYMLQIVESSGVLFHSPLPACHSEPPINVTISLPLRFWDFSMAKYTTLDLQCPFENTPETPAPVTPTMLPAPPSTTKLKVSPHTVAELKVFCSSYRMTVELPPGPISGIVVKDIKGNQINLQDAPQHCGYSARKGKDGKINLSLQLHLRCYMSLQGKKYIISIIYMTARGRLESQFSCPVLVPGFGQECNLPNEQRLPCGPRSISQPRCLSTGCCFSDQPPGCYYPMDECTIDRHFVFTLPASLTDPPLSPSLLVAAGNSTCKPERVTSDYALFKIPMDGCGTRRVMVGKTVIYIVEIINKVHTLSLNYGTITRDSPVRLLVECRYLPNTVLSVSYMVKTPTLGPAVHTQGVFGVQLRIAKDAQYSSYHPQYHQPLLMLLGKPLYLEVRLLNTADPSLVLLVHFCVAYPRSGTAVWLLLYNGCPNPLDPAPQQALVLDPQAPSPQAQTRRFTISTFQFLPVGELEHPDEEIYFMCSTEICSPRDGPCIEGCFGD